MKHRFLILLILLLSSFASAQAPKEIDSLIGSLKAEQHDTSKANTCNRISEAYRYVDVNKNREYAQRAIAYSRQSQFDRGRGTAYNLLAQSYENQGLFGEAIVYYDSALVVMRSLKNIKNEANILLNISNVYQKTADYATSVDYCVRSLTLQEQLNDTFGIAVCRLTLGNIHYGQGDFKSALSNYVGALEMNKKSAKNPGFEGATLANIGAILVEQKAYDSALVNFRRAEIIFRSIHADAKTAMAIGNIGTCYYHLGNNDSALHYLHTANEMSEQLARPEGTSSALRGLGLVHGSLNNSDSALYYLRASAKVSMQHNLKENLLLSYEFLSEQFEKIENFDSALIYLRKYLELNEVIHGEDEITKVDQVRQNYSISKKEQELKLKESEAALHEQTLRNRISLLAGGLIVLILVSLLLFSRYRAKQQIAAVLSKTNREITSQKNEITDSINYARRIQDSILAPMHVVKEVLPDSFILYMPKDVVSGDFYWVEEENGHAIFAAVDCTGHGVPGALMSVVGFNLLNRAVKELHFTKPSDILQQLDYGVNKLLRQSDEGNTVKDGMDLSLCSYHAESRMLQYGGVFNPLYIVREGNIIQITADKTPIGMNVDGVADSFTNHEIQMQPGDMVYLLSDGYADQFGGPKGKKYKYNKLRDLLIAISSLSTKDQEIQLRESFINWQGSLEQVDDVLIIGVRIS